MLLINRVFNKRHKMGNSNTNAPSKGKPFPHGSVEIFFENNLYYAGEIIAGTVRLNLTQPFPSPSFMIQIKGVEKAHNSIVPENRGNRQEFKDQHILVTNQFVITSPEPDKFPAGNYSYPFSFQLDSQLPSSFFNDVTITGQTSKAKISYKIQAGLFDPSSTYYLIRKQPFYVTSFKQLVDSTLTNSLKVKQSGISAFLFSSYVTLSIGVLDNKAAAGNDFQVEIGVDAKDAKHSVNGLVFELIQSIIVHINGSKVQANKTIWSKDIQLRVEKGTSMLSPNGFKLLVPGTVTANLMNSCLTKNIENTYRLKLSLPKETDFINGFFEKDSDLVLPLQIYRKRAQIVHQFIAPHDQASQMSHANQHPSPVPNPMYPPPGQYPMHGQPQFMPQGQLLPNPGFGPHVQLPPNQGYGPQGQLPPNPGFGSQGQMPSNPGFVQPQGQLPPNPGMILPAPSTESNEFRVNYPSFDDEHFKHL